MARYRFDEIAFNITDKRMPTPEDKDLYIGLEHLDTRCLRVSRWGSAVDITGQKLVMRKGDVLFGRRNTYLRRAAIAPHDGLFSAHGMIFRPKTNVITEEFFPYFIVSNYFMDAAIRISVGSLSPTVNWKQLKELEFDIPDIDKQHKYAELFAAIDGTKEAYKQLISATDELVKSQFIELFGDPATNTKGWVVKHLPDISENLDSRRIPITSGSRKEGQYPYYGASGIVDYVEEYIFDEDLLLISEDGANLLARVTPIAFPSSGKVWVNNHAHVVRFSSAFTQCYVENLLNMIDISHYVTGTAQPKLNQAKLNTIPIPDPPTELQKQFAAIVKQSDKSKFEAKQSLESLDVLYRNMEKQCFC